MNIVAMLISAGFALSSAGGAANAPSRSSSGQSMVCSIRTSPRGRTSASVSRERSATFTMPARPAFSSASRSSTYGLTPGPSASRKYDLAK